MNKEPWNEWITWIARPCLCVLLLVVYGCGLDDKLNNADFQPRIGDSIYSFKSAKVIESNKDYDKYEVTVKERGFYFYVTTDKSGIITSFWTRGQ